MGRVRAGTGVQNERRLACLHRLGLLDSPAEPAFDRLTRLVTRLLGVPVSLVSLVDVDRQFFKRSVGLPEPWAFRRETPLSHSFCQYVVETGEPLIVPDALSDPLVCTNLAISDLHVQAYLGVPLSTTDGMVLGSLCAIDTAPRVWEPDAIELICDLAVAAVAEIELRRDILARQQAEAALYESNARFAGAFSHASIGMAIVAPAGRWLQVNRALCALVGYSEQELLGLTFQQLTHPDDLDADLAYVQQMLAGAIETYQMDKRYLRNESLHRTEALYQIAEVLNHTQEMPAILQTVVERAAQVLPADRTVLITIDQAAQAVRQQLEAGAGAQHVPPLAFAELCEGLSGVVLREGEPVRSLKGASDARESDAVQRRRMRDRAGSILVAPIRSQGSFYGTLTARTAGRRGARPGRPRPPPRRRPLSRGAGSLSR